jgi:hypothetical protein
MAAPDALKVPPPFGVVRDVGAFFSALVPKNKTAAAPRALVPTVDVVLTAKGRPVRWLCTGEGGETTEKLSTDRAAMLRVSYLMVQCVFTSAGDSERWGEAHARAFQARVAAALSA